MNNHQFFAIALFLNLVLCCTSDLFAQQWSQNTTSIWNTNLNANVGIGTTNPTAKLHVAGTVFVGPQNATVEGGKIQLAGNGSNPTWSVDVFNDRFRIHSLGTEKITALPNGNIGVGTTSPQYPLDVRGSISNGGSDFVLGRYDGRPQKNISFNRALVHRWVGNYTDNLIINYAGDFEDGTKVEGPGLMIGVDRLPSGYKLSVGGKVICEEIKVQLQNAWPDYVFAPNYDLQSLEAVEAHIKEKQHLPGIPSACEMEEKGLSLGEMQAKMMEKIEELTLYLIELKKDNASLRQEMKNLKHK